MARKLHPAAVGALISGLLVVALSGPTLAAEASSRTSVWCADKGPLSKPKSCEFYSRRGIAGTFVTGLRWRNWGKPATTATGTFRGNMGVRSQMTVRLSRRDACQAGGPYVYTKAEFRQAGTSRWSGGRIVSCDGAG